MSLSFLQIKQLRNITSAQITPSPHLNFICGDNGSGKTSLFEAISYLILGRSFRTRHNTKSIQYSMEQLSLFAKIKQKDQLSVIGVERHIDGTNKIRLNKENKSSIIDITKQLPLQIITPETRYLLSGTSKPRRNFLDWGVFHMEHSFAKAWQQTQRTIKQRNAALKTSQNKQLIQLWDQELHYFAEILHKHRQAYVNALEPIFFDILASLLPDKYMVSLKYKPGWDTNEGLSGVLNNNFFKDKQLGYTQHGPHRADILFKVNKTALAQDALSQGQQKLLIYALFLSQALVLKTITARRCVFLFDDLSAELDRQNRNKVINILQKIDTQIFITSLNKEYYNEHIDSNSKLFHVKHGDFKEE